MTKDCKLLYIFNVEGNPCAPRSSKIIVNFYLRKWIININAKTRELTRVATCNHKRQGKTKKKWLKKPNDKNSKKRLLERRSKPRMFLKVAFTS